jgi:beta-lactamase regulating signal transducer with metallopeptidase domain
METWFNFISGLSSEGLSMAVNGLWLGVVLTGLSWLIWRLIKTSNAATGYVVWWSVLTVVIALPFLVGRPVTDWFESRVEQPIPTISATGLSAETLPVGARANLAGPELVANSVSSPAENMRSDAIATHVAEAASRTVTASVGSREENSVFSLLVKLLPISLFGIWLCVSLLFLLRLLSAHRRMVSIKRGSSPFDISGFARLDNIINRAAAIRSIRVNLSSEIDFPMAAGLGHPMVLIPRRLVNQLTSGELESVILHELAHILRWDDWTKLGQKIIEAFMFFNPAVFWIGRRLDLEREIACDDRVVEHLGRPDDYARCLTRLTQLTAMPVGASLISGVLTNRKQIFKRFDRLLNGRRNGSTRFSRKHFFGAFAGIVVALAIAVRVAPAIAVPVEAVTLDELYGTAQSVAENVWFDFLADEPQDNRVLANDSDLAKLGAEPKIVDDGYPSAIEKNPVSEDYPTGLVAGFIPEAEILLETPAVFAVAENPVDDTDDVADTEIRADERVIDWNDEIFDLPISGTIHGVGRWDEAFDVWYDEERELRAAVQGQLRFTVDGRDVKSISEGGWLAVKEQYGSVWRELDVKPDKDGKLLYAYYVDGTPREYDKKARQWFAGVLRDIFPEALSSSGRMVSGIFEPAEPLEPTLLSELAQPAAPAEPLEPLDPPKSRIENRSLLSKIFDWGKDPFDKLGKGTLISTDDDGAWVDICWSDGRDKMRIKMDGELELTDDDRDIKSISRGGYFAVWEKRGSKRRELVVEPERNGVLNYGYYVDGKNRDFDDDAREWLADALPRMCRVAGINAESRAWRIYQRDGVDGVLDEISRIESDFVKRKYFDTLLDSDELSDDEYSTMLGQIERELDSDYEKAQLLIDMADRVTQNKNLIRDYVNVVETIDSDHETRSVLAALSIEEHADDDIILAVLEIAARMDSDYEKAELLIEFWRLIAATTGRCRPPM